MACGPQALKEDCDWSQAKDSGGSFLFCEATFENHCRESHILMAVVLLELAVLLELHCSVNCAPR